MTSRHFTDADNTGAPLVPIIADAGRRPTQSDAEYLEEVIWSHRR